MSDTNDSGTSGSYRTTTCAECGNRYPFGGSTIKSVVESSPESAEHHAPGCSIRKMLKGRGQTADRDAHRSLHTEKEQ